MSESLKLYQVFSCIVKNIDTVYEMLLFGMYVLLGLLYQAEKRFYSGSHLAHYNKPVFCGNIAMNRYNATLSLLRPQGKLITKFKKGNNPKS